eukprot:TRINITY_DN4202_c0_g2_i4.p1 TRINITY_DN4202_c0_g2~~TRINITY_DN4202_c0_g2_i4.p1  ORF type:complete len:508 (-),score=63.13 TRINITY_DN4202_c0_g2_i4:1257-2675(-)
MGTSQQFNIVKNTTDFVIDNLIAQDYFGIVSFKDQAEELIRLQRVQQQRGSYKELVNQLFASNDSNLAEGVLTGLEQHEQLPLQDNIIRGTIIVSDGDPNTGITDPTTVKSLVESKFQSLEERVRLFTVATVGAKFTLLEDIASIGQGALLYLTRPEDLQKAFGLQFGGLISTYYQDIILNINPQPGVRIGKISTGGQVIDNENNVQVKFNDLRADEGRDLLVDLEFDDQGSQELPDNLIEITVDYVFQFAQGMSLGGSFTVGSSEVVQDQDPLIDISVLRFEVTNLLNQSKSVSNTQEVQQAVSQAQSLQQTFEDLKNGGMRQLLQDAPPSQTLELGFGGTRKLLQTTQDQAVQSDEFFRLFESLNLTLADTLNILRQIDGFLDDGDDIDSNDLQRLRVTLDSLRFSLDLQRLEIVPTEEFAGVEAVGQLLITPVQDALSRGIKFFEEEDDLFITLTIPPEYQEYLTLILP